MKRNTRLIQALAILTDELMAVVNVQNFTATIKYCDILIKCLANLFSDIDFCNEKILYFFDSTNPKL